MSRAPEYRRVVCRRTSACLRRLLEYQTSRRQFSDIDEVEAQVPLRELDDSSKSHLTVYVGRFPCRRLHHGSPQRTRWCWCAWVCFDTMVEYLEIRRLADPAADLRWDVDYLDAMRCDGLIPTAALGPSGRSSAQQRRNDSTRRSQRVRKVANC